MDQSIRHIKFEMDGLLWDNYWCAMNSEMGKFDWDVVLGFSIESARDIIMEKAPIIWMLLTSLAIDHCCPQLAESRMKCKPCGHGSNQTRDPYLVSSTNPILYPSLQTTSHLVLHSHSDAHAIYEELQHE